MCFFFCPLSGRRELFFSTSKKMLLSKIHWQCHFNNNEFIPIKIHFFYILPKTMWDMVMDRHKLGFWSMIEYHFEKYRHKMQENRSNCFGSKKRSSTLRQAKTDKHKCGNITETYLLLHPKQLLWVSYILWCNFWKRYSVKLSEISK